MLPHRRHDQSHSREKLYILTYTRPETMPVTWRCPREGDAHERAEPMRRLRTHFSRTISQSPAEHLSADDAFFAPISGNSLEIQSEEEHTFSITNLYATKILFEVMKNPAAICQLPPGAGYPAHIGARLKRRAYGFNDAPRLWWLHRCAVIV